MAVTIKSHSEIELMRKSCKLLAIVHEEMKNALRPGMTTYDINIVGEKTIKKLGCKPNFKNYNGFKNCVRNENQK